MAFAHNDPRPTGKPSDEQNAFVLERGKRFEVRCGAEKSYVCIVKVQPQWLEFENEVNGRPREPRNFIVVRHDAFRITIRRELTALSLGQQVQRGY